MYSLTNYKEMHSSSLYHYFNQYLKSIYHVQGFVIDTLQASSHFIFRKDPKMQILLLSPLTDKETKAYRDLTKVTQPTQMYLNPSNVILNH